MRRLSAVSVPVLIAVWLLTDMWRLWTPSLITLFGRAAETPPEIMGAFALGVVAAPLILLALVRTQAPRLAGSLLAAAFVVGVALRFAPAGGDVQLYGSSAGVLLAVAALCLLAGTAGQSLLPNVFLGVALAVSTHAALGSFGAVWRRDPLDVVLLVTQGALVAVALRSLLAAPADSPASPRSGLLVFPVLLVLQLALANVGRGSTINLLWGPLLVVLGIWLAVVFAFLPPPNRRPWVAAAVFVAAVFLAVPLEVTRGGIPGQLSLWALAAFAVGPAALARLVTYAAGARSPRRATLATGAGAVAWVAFLFLFYAGYDLGYRADWAIVLLALLITAAALAQRSPAGAAVGSPARSLQAGPTTGADAAGAAAAGIRWRPMFGTVGIIAAFAAALTVLGPPLTVQPLEEAAAASTGEAPTSGAASDAAEAAAAGAGSRGADTLTVAAYNVRMGYGIDGTFDPVGVAEQIRGSGAQVALLSEVDRGWLLNGGQDQLAILARLLDMQLVFGPAGDQVWGDAILTSLPLSNVSAEPFPAFDSLTGAAMTHATVAWRGKEIGLISTHLQPDADDDTLRQAEVLAAAMSEAAGSGPLIAGGDLNTEPGSPAWRALLAAGATDALAQQRPAPTWSAEDPQKQIDHLFVSGLEIVDAGVTESLLSDHLMVTVTVR